MRSSPASFTLISLILAPVLWGGNFVLGSAMSGALSGPDLNFARWLVALLVLLPLLGTALLRDRSAVWS